MLEFHHKEGLLPFPKTNLNPFEEGLSQNSLSMPQATFNIYPTQCRIVCETYSFRDDPSLSLSHLQTVLSFQGFISSYFCEFQPHTARLYAHPPSA